MVNPRTGHAPTIQQLTLTAIASGANTSDLERRSGGVIARQQFDRYRDGDVPGWPKNTETFGAVAAALGSDVRTVVLAFASQLGIDVPEHTTSVEPTKWTLGVDMDDFSDAEVRSATDLWQELQRRAETTTPGMARLLRRLAFLLADQFEE